MILITAYILFFLCAFPIALSTDRVFGLYFAALFVYSLFALVGYLFLPGLSESIHAYFGDSVGHTAAAFCLVSLVGFFVINYVIFKKTKPVTLVNIRASGSITHTGLGVLFALVFAFSILMISHFSELSWYIHQYDGQLSLSLTVFLLLVKISVGILAVCYVVWRSEIIHGRVFVVLSLLYFAVFVIAAFKLGNRTDLAALLLGIIAFELSRRKIGLKTLFWTGAATVFFVIVLSLVEQYRYIGGAGDRALVDRIIQNDYYAPAHMLFASIAYDFVDAKEVLKSNFANSFILFNYPYLQATVTDLFNPGLATRSSSYGFYIFTEGWIFIGALGVVYNWLVPTAGLMLWRMLGSTNSRLVNHTVIALTGCMILNLVRGQSSYFIKYLYTFAAPGLLFLVILVGLRMSVSSRSSRPLPPVALN
jgi:hypothetical protein